MDFSTAIDYEQLVKGVPDGLLLVDESGDIKDTNPRVTDLFGYTAAELEDEPIEVLVPEPFREDHISQRKEYSSNPSRRSMGSGLQLVGRRKDGSIFPVDVSLSPVQGMDQQWIIASVRDISDRVARQQRLSVLTRILRHDIRNRLTIIIGYAETSKDLLEYLDARLEKATQSTTEDPTIETIMEDLHDQTDNITKLLKEVDDITDSNIGAIERILKAAMELESLAGRARRIDKILATGDLIADPFDLKSILEGSATTMQALHPEASIQQNLDEGITLHQPKAIVRICVEELLDNAIKHADSPDPWVSIETGTQDGSHVEIMISDEGPGLPEQERKVLSMLEEAPLIHSMGFGLWEVNWLVSRMGGNLRFEDNEPQGTIGVIRLPIESIKND